MDLLRHFEQQQTKDVERPRLRSGDIVRVATKVKEGDKERVQTFEGTILGIRGQGPSVTFTVRREVGRFAVERIFPLYSPLITTIEIVKRQKVRRAKLNYLRAAGRRRIKEDELAMQRHVHEEKEKERLAAEATKREAEKAAKEASRQAQAEAAAKEKAEAAAQAEEEKPAEEASADESATDAPSDQADKS